MLSMEKIIYDTEEKQKDREKTFVCSPARLNALEAISKEIVEDIIKRMKTDNYTHIQKGAHTTVIEFDSYYHGEYSVMSDRVVIWNGDNNGVDWVAFHNMDCLPSGIPQDLQQPLWDAIVNALNAQKAQMKYAEYLKAKDDAKTQAEIEKAKKIAEAKAVLEKYGNN